MDGMQQAKDRTMKEGGPKGMAPEGMPPGRKGPEGMPPGGKGPEGMPPGRKGPEGMPPGGMPPQGRGPRKRRPGGMPPGTPPDPQTQEIAFAVMPDFPRWRLVFFKLDCVCAAITFILALVFFVYFSSKGIIRGHELGYFISHAVVPTVLHLLILGGAAVLRKRLPEMDMRQNAIPIFALLLINLVMCLTHSTFLATMCIYCIPICMTTVFSNKKLCQVVTNFSIAAVIITVVKEFLLDSGPDQRMWIIPQGIVIVCILVIMGIVAQTALSMTDGQKQKLFEYAISIKEAQHRAEAASIAKSAFLANMSHEIRTPINAILGMNEMILRENTDEQIEEYARNVHTAGNSLLYLVNDVLDISKIESGKLEIVEMNYDTASFIHDCYNMVAERAEKKGLDLKIECSRDLPARLRGDEVRLRQVVTNLLSNAAKYTEKGSITLAVEGSMEQDQFSLIVEVRDTGIGIKEENLQSLFTQFTRFDLEKNRNIEGTGLGLAISHQLVGLMQGEIKVHSIYGIGSAFTVKVPQQIIDASPMGDFNEHFRDVNGKNAHYKQDFEAPDAKILVVDDVEVNLKVIANLLKATKIKVDVAHNGEQCLVMTEQNEYDVIFLDHMMPEMDGVETYARMRGRSSEMNRQTPVIMLTANAISGVREQYLQEGFADYLSKPVSGDKLEKMLLKYLPENKIRRDIADKQQETPKDAGEPKSDTRTADSGAAEGRSLKADAGASDSGAADSDGRIPNLDGIDPKLWKLIKRYPKVDIPLGMATCGDDTDIYIEIIKAFVEDSKEDALKAHYENRDIRNYQVLVHGAKSAALSIGFSCLSEMARALENACKAEDWEFIDGNHSAFMAEYHAVVEAISHAFEE